MGAAEIKQLSKSVSHHVFAPAWITSSSSSLGLKLFWKTKILLKHWLKQRKTGFLWCTLVSPCLSSWKVFASFKAVNVNPCCFTNSQLKTNHQKPYCYIIKTSHSYCFCGEFPQAQGLSTRLKVVRIPSLSILSESLGKNPFPCFSS